MDRSGELGARCVITTEKDAVRLKHLQFGEGELMVFQIEARPEDRDEFLRVWKEELESLLPPQ